MSELPLKQGENLQEIRLPKEEQALDRILPPLRQLTLRESQTYYFSD